MIFGRDAFKHCSLFLIALFLFIANIVPGDGLAINSQQHAKNRIGNDHERNLFKRGSCFSKEDEWSCSSDTPPVSECVSRIQSWGNVGSRTSVFYTGLGGAQGLTQCKQYFACNPQIGPTVLWDDIVDPDWMVAQAQAIVKANPGSNPNSITDPFQKRMSQAFGEASSGDAYVCTPESNAPQNDFDQNLAWGGWEYPALTRNSRVTRVFRVDPNTNVLALIWTQGDPPTPNAPRG